MSNDELPDSPFETIDDGTSDGIDGEESLSSPAGGPMDRLFDGDAPGPAVGELKADYDMPQWLAILSRGIMRVATGDGVPPIAEIVIGAIMGVMGSDMNVTGSSDDGESTSENTAQSASGAPPGVSMK